MSYSETGETLRVHFEDLGKCYTHLTKWYGFHSLWWWVRRLGQLSVRDDEDNWVYSLHTNAKDIKPTQKIKAHMFALAFQFTDHWRECAQRLSRSAGETSAQPVVNADHEEQLLAWLDLHLYIVWKYLSDWTQHGFPFFTFIRRDDLATMDDDGHPALFSEDQYLGLRSVKQAYEWQLQWTTRGFQAYLFWNAHEAELEGMGLLTQRLMDDRTEAGFQRSLAALVIAVRNHRRRQRRREPYCLRPLAPTPTLARIGAMLTQIQTMLAGVVKEESNDHDECPPAIKEDNDEDEEDSEDDEDEEGQSEPEGQQQVDYLRRASRERRRDATAFPHRFLGRAPTKKMRPSPTITTTSRSLVSRRRRRDDADEAHTTPTPRDDLRRAARTTLCTK